jgi:CTP synthase (UTP-ammonia lyase)
VVEEEYYCQFGLNHEYQPLIEQSDLRIAGVDQDGEVRILELPAHRFFIATLLVPQAASTPQAPHPLITAYLAAAAEFQRQKESSLKTTSA